MGIGKRQMERIKSKLRAEWFRNIMMKKLVTTLTKEVADEHVDAVRHAVVRYVLMDADERKRLNIRRAPKIFR